MVLQDYSNYYEEQWHLFPVEAEEYSIEGAFKRFMPMPGPKEVYDYAMMGLPRKLPFTGEIITQYGLVNPQTNQITTDINIEDFLSSALSEIEMSLGCRLSEVTQFHTVDYIDGMDTTNFYGIKLPVWPATKIVKMSLVFPHATSAPSARFMEYVFPPNWITLKKNKINVVFSAGATTVDFNTPSALTPGGLFSYAAAFARGPFRPNAISIAYKAGFNHDKLPPVIADLIKTWAASRYLIDISPVLFPSNSVSNSLDGVSQSVNIATPQLITQRIENLEKKKAELKQAFVKSFGRTVGLMFVGS